jgi:hypothetical protein
MRMNTQGFENKSAPLASRARFRARVAGAALLSLALILSTLAVGVTGFHWIERLDWLDAFHQSAMLLAGMGPVVTVTSAAGKLFDGIYALFCGIVLIAATGILFAPLVHRLLHRFHLDDARQ